MKYISRIKKYILIIIDMQEYLIPDQKDSHNQHIIDNCIREIKRAKKLNNEIIAVEFRDSEPFKHTDPTLLSKIFTHHLLKAVIGKYKKARIIPKLWQDGGGILRAAIKKPQHLRFVGLYTPYCVGETVKTVATGVGYQTNLQPYSNRCKIEVVADATAGPNVIEHEQALAEMSQLKNVYIV